MHPHNPDTTNTMSKKKKKVRDGGHALRDALQTIADRMHWMADQIPEDQDNLTDDECEEIARIVNDIWSMEEEWILDPDLREELSVIKVE